MGELRQPTQTVDFRLKRSFLLCRPTQMLSDSEGQKMVINQEDKEKQRRRGQTRQDDDKYSGGKKQRGKWSIRQQNGWSDDGMLQSRCTAEKRTPKETPYRQATVAEWVVRPWAKNWASERVQRVYRVLPAPGPERNQYRLKPWSKKAKGSRKEVPREKREGRLKNCVAFKRSENY